MSDPLPPDLRLTWDAYLELGSVKRAAERLFLSEITVNRHLRAIRALLGCETNVQVANKLARMAA